MKVVSPKDVAEDEVVLPKDIPEGQGYSTRELSKGKTQTFSKERNSNGPQAYKKEKVNKFY